MSGPFTITCGECYEKASKEREEWGRKTGFRNPMLTVTVVSGATLLDAWSAFVKHVDEKHPEKLDYLWESLQMTYYARPKEALEPLHAVNLEGPHFCKPGDRTKVRNETTGAVMELEFVSEDIKKQELRVRMDDGTEIILKKMKAN